jgi:hypothetical protein
MGQLTEAIIWQSAEHGYGRRRLSVPRYRLSIAGVMSHPWYEQWEIEALDE